VYSSKDGYRRHVDKKHCDLYVYKLLKEMLKLDPTERMTFPQFFDTVDDIITSKIEIVNLLHGTSHQIINDPNLT
jgi:hypothetical protein